MSVREAKRRTILAEVAALHGVSVEQIIDPRHRSRAMVQIRDCAIYRLMDETDFSLLRISQIVGRKDHTTAFYACRRHARRHGLPVPRGGRL